MLISQPVSKSVAAMPVDPFELALVVSISNQVMERENRRLTPHMPTGEGDSLAVSQNAYHQILIELRDLYQEDNPGKFVSICWRLFSLYKLIQSGELEEWVSSDYLRYDHSFPPAVIFIAATLPLQDKKGFDARRFVAALRECISCDLYN